MARCDDILLRLAIWNSRLLAFPDCKYFGGPSWSQTGAAAHLERCGITVSHVPSAVQQMQAPLLQSIACSFESALLLAC